jgi:cell division septum initiation protein DivIVA
VENFLSLVAEELAQRLGDLERLERENAALRERQRELEARERELQEALLRGTRLSEEIVQASHREAQLLLREAEHAADRLVTQAAERAREIENRIAELRARRRELQVKLRGTLELFSRLLEADTEEELQSAEVTTLLRKAGGKA